MRLPRRAVLPLLFGALFTLTVGVATIIAQPPPELEEPAALTPSGARTAPRPPASSVGTHSVPATGTGYDLDFTLPTAAKAGCSVCHGDPGLTRLKDGALVSFFVDPAVTDASAHSGVPCTGCHVSFASTTPHEASVGDWRTEAKSVCRNCHSAQFISYGRGSHRLEPSADGTGTTNGGRVPLCGDCHGSHAMSSLTEGRAGQDAMHRDGWNVCGRCHQDYWDSYDDYYHGAAFKRGALDAPACWDCHGWHEVLPSSDPDSLVSSRHLAETCGKCHADSSEEFLDYARLIHGRAQVADGVSLYALIHQVRDFVRGLFGR